MESHIAWYCGRPTLLAMWNDPFIFKVYSEIASTNGGSPSSSLNEKTVKRASGTSSASFWKKRSPLFVATRRQMWTGICATLQADPLGVLAHTRKYCPRAEGHAGCCNAGRRAQPRPSAGVGLADGVLRRLEKAGKVGNLGKIDMEG